MTDRDTETDVHTDGGTETGADPTGERADASTDDDVLVRVDGLKKHFPVDSGLVSDLMNTIRGEDSKMVHAVDGVSFELRAGETFGIAGESGCGKTTTGMSLAKLYEPTDGSIYYDGDDIANKTGKDLSTFRQNAQMIFQDPFESLNPQMTVYDTVVEPLRIHDRPNQRARVRRALEFAGLRPPDQFFDQYPHELSGGQRQRLAIARALVIDPDFIVADEPVSMLDVSLRAGVLSLLERMTDEFGLSVVYISHDLSLLRHMCDRIAIMYMGKIVEQGPTEEIITNPKHPYTRSLIDAVPVPDPHSQRERVELEGEVGDAINVPSGCRFKGRCEEHIGPVCDQVTPRLERKADVEGGREVACHLYESAEGFDPYAEVGTADADADSDGSARAPGDD
ncbi:ABC transporter ATP-binding protein [Candidatus Halobonum tyrrellensis]|uniref:Oligopeptide/dipeptide ABC transporter ATP-binding protein n=1 Tax=Candidatus Halobonum tyrrellensis G22 TaxID=1324957 RepID=V4IZB8_9EURY|nr:ABC transporter ATP-binding protein [Candidatus Halobonum tyrrellensis]ESP88467.1 oligopeptide/dipeptide ABC transporter ATP-binding protein [Candidatus Halobonum tyrrellensis G22]